MPEQSRCVPPTPLGVPGITYNYFDNGNGDRPADITAISQAIDLGRDSIEK
jgi:hypothetical protein